MAAIAVAFPLAPMSDVVPEWGARRVLAHARNGLSSKSIGGILGVSTATVDRILNAAGPDRNVARVPRQGQGRVNDMRFHFAGDQGPGNLEALERCREAAEDDELLLDTYLRFIDLTDCTASYRSLCRALMSTLNFTTKRLSERAHERDALRCDIWFNDVRTKFSASQLVCVDESSADKRLHTRRVGISKRGKRATSRNCFYNRGQRFSVVAPFDLSCGFLDCYVVEDSFDHETFLIALHRVVVHCCCSPRLLAS